MRPFIAILCALTLASCASKEEKSEPEKTIETRFVELTSENTGITFSNNIEENDSINVVLYDYLYNGGGVAAGDLNNDGLIDLYFTGNQVGDRLYINNGDFTFTDVTEKWGIDRYPGWSSGAVMVDINNDGWLDVYVCRTGPHKNPELRTNRLFINQQGTGFSEEAAAYGLDYTGHSTMAAFFDADLDGDLDCYLMTHPGIFQHRMPIADWHNLVSQGQIEHDRFFKNEGGKFVDASHEAGIQQAAYGLGLSIEDFNNDGYPDIYVSNDFDEGDFMYINNGDGTFSNQVTAMMKHTSNYGMGCDAADFNNDRYVDLIQVDMAFETHERAKRNMAAMDQQRFNARVQLGWHFQYMVNVLQLNNGDNTFSDIAQISGVHKTDWSWAALFADFNNDGLQDLFITNGYKRDTKDNDIKSRLKKLAGEKKSLPINDMLNIMPSTKLKNYMFQNIDGLQFKRVNDDWGLHQKINSNGAVYVDLNGDGDLDLVVNNVDQPASVYRNMTNENSSNNENWVGFRLPAGYRTGSRVVIKTSDGEQMRYLQPTRGYLGSTPHELHFGVGMNSNIDSVIVIWPNRKTSLITDLKTNQYHTLEYKPTGTQNYFTKQKPLFKNVTAEAQINFKHTENPFDDFEVEVLLPHKMSEHGPGIVKGDFNGDGLEDVWIGGAAGQAGAIYIRMADGSFQRSNQPALLSHAACEDVAAVCLDVNGDGHLDLFVVSGDAGKGEESSLLRDRLYINSGTGVLRDVTATLPDVRFAGGDVAVADVNGDGRPDIFIGGRHIPQKYPFPPKSQLLMNNGSGYSDETTAWFGNDFRPGLVTSVQFHDFNNDNKPDLLMAGEWMSPKIYLNNGESFGEGIPLADEQEGWWFALEIADINNDGRPDIVAGNIGRNNKFQPSTAKPLYCYAHDFDQNGSIDIVLAKYEKSELVPVRGKECSTAQMPFISEQFETYEEFAVSTLVEIYTEESLNSAYRPDAKTFSSKVFYNEGNMKWRIAELPIMAQFSSVRSIIVTDVNGNGLEDLILSGNFFGVEVETTRYDASNGVVLLNQGDESWQQLMPHESGFSVPLDARRSVLINHPADRREIITANNGTFPTVHQLLIEP